MFGSAPTGRSLLSHWALLALDAFVSGKPLAASSNDVEDEDQDDEEGQGDADGDRDDIVGHVVAVHRSLDEDINVKLELEVNVLIKRSADFIKLK
jgi:hypothetical protein